jgi:putative membrane protein
MLLAALLSALHLLALPVGFAAVLLRGRGLRELSKVRDDEAARAALFRADNLWGLAALLWLATGLTRAFAGVEKASDFYLRNGFFWVKMALFLLVLTLELQPMVAFMRWRLAGPRAGELVAAAPLERLVLLNDLETGLVLVIPFAAALMARGVWLF